MLEVFYFREGFVLKASRYEKVDEGDIYTKKRITKNSSHKLGRKIWLWILNKGRVKG